MKRMNVLNKVLLLSMITVVSSNVFGFIGTSMMSPRFLGVTAVGIVKDAGCKVSSFVTNKACFAGVYAENVIIKHSGKLITAAVAAAPFAFGKVRKGAANIASKLVQKVWKKKVVRKSFWAKLSSYVWKKPVVKKTLWRKATGLFGL